MTVAAITAVRAARKHRWLLSAPIVGGFMFVAVPIALLGGVTSLQCPAAVTVDAPAGGGPAAAGLYAPPLRLEPGAWYQVGATQYGGPDDPASGDYGAIGA